MRLIVVGAGATTRDLLRGLGDAWQVTVIDEDPALLDALDEVRSVATITGDGGSVAVLRDAGLAEANALVAASVRDDTNLVACRLAKESRVATVAAVPADPERLANFRELDVQVFSPDRLAARRIETILEPRRVSSVEFAEGMAEASEFRIARDSPIRGRALQEFDFTDWLVVAVLRDNNLIVPHGGTVLQTDDIVTVVGDPARSAEMVKAFTEGQARFPRDHGTKVATFAGTSAGDERRISEAEHLVEHSAADGLVLLQRADTPPPTRHRASGDHSTDVVVDRGEGGLPDPAAVSEAGAGVVVVDPPAVGRLAERWASIQMVRYAQEIGRPLLVSRGSHPYRRIILGVSSKPHTAAAAAAAVDLAAIHRLILAAVTVVSPPFIAGPGPTTAATTSQLRLGEAAAIHGVALEVATREGNPIHVLEAMASDDSLLVLAVPGRQPTMINPGVAAFLVRRAASSVLLVAGL